jgi:G3E family GTPase
VVDPVRYHAMSTAWPESETESDLAYLFRHQLDEADIIAVNKLDLTEPAVAAAVVDDVAGRFPHAAVIPYSATTGDGLDALLDAWVIRSTSNGHRAFDVDWTTTGTVRRRPN